MRKKRRNMEIPTRRRNKDIPTKKRNMDILMRKKNKRRRQLQPYLHFYHALEDYSVHKSDQNLNRLILKKYLNNLMAPKLLSHIQIIPLHLLKQSKWRMTRVTTTTLNQIKNRNAPTDLNISVDYYRTEHILASKDHSHSPFAFANMLLT